MIIASRVLQFATHSGTKTVQIDLFRPEQNDGDWICHYTVHWPDKAWQSFGGGYDAIQALLSALQKIGFELYASEANKTGKLTWGNWEGFGFPVPQNARDLLKGDDAKFL